jgi:peroxiredoxin
MLAEGDAAPDFILPDQNGDEVSLSELRGQTVVLYFYPRADTPGLNCSSDLSLTHVLQAWLRTATSNQTSTIPAERKRRVRDSNPQAC